MLLFCDGFSHYNTLAQKGWTLTGSGGSVFSIQAGAGRFGNAALRSFQDKDALQTLPGNFGTLILQWGARVNTLNATGATVTLMDLRDNGTSQLRLELQSNNKPRLVGGSTLFTDTAHQFLADTYYYIELKVVFGNSGSVHLKINGQTIYNQSGVDTRNSANDYANEFNIHQPNTGGFTFDTSDLIVMDDSGAFMNDFLGDKKISTGFPSGAGNYTDFTPSTGSNYQCVDENPPNDDTDYVGSPNVGDKDTYAMGTFTGLTGVEAVVLNHRAKKTDAGTREITAKVRSNSVDDDGASIPLSASYAFYQTPFYENPDGPVAWTTATINAMEAGQEVAA